MVDNHGACAPTAALCGDTQHSESARICDGVEPNRVVDSAPTERDGFVAVIESRGFIRECMQRTLQAALPLPVVAYSAVKEFERQPGGDSARLIILSMLLSHEESGKTCEYLSGLLPGAPIIVLADTNDATLARTVIRHGAKGYIPWTMGFEIAVTATRFVLAGGTYVPLDIFLADASSGTAPAQGFQEVRRGEPDKLSAPQSALRQCTIRIDSAGATSDQLASSALTRRELLVIEGIQQGKSNKIIAYQLNVCESTVKVHVRNVMKKLAARNRTQVAIRAQSMLSTTKAIVSTEAAAEAA